MNDFWRANAEAAAQVSLEERQAASRDELEHRLADGLDLSALNRVYLDFFVSQAGFADLEHVLEANGYNVFFRGTGEPTALKAVLEKVWSHKELSILDMQMTDLGAVMSAIYDGWFIISPAEDDEK